MKKALFSIFAVCALFACNKVEKEAPVQEQGTPVTFNITVSGTDDTKAVKSAWVTGDVINIFFEGLEEKYLCITYNSEATPKWAVSMPNGNITAGEFAALNKELTAVHFPVAVDVAWDDTNKKFDFTAGGKPVYNYYLLQEDADYTVDEDVVTVTLALGKPGDFVWFHVNGIQANPELYKLMEPSITPVACTSVAKAGGVAETLGTAGYPLTGIADADGAIYAGRKTSAQTTYAFQLVKVFSTTYDIAEGTYTKEGTKTFVAGKQYGLPDPASWTWNKWVNLGYTSNNVLWSTGYMTDNGALSGGGSIVGFREDGGYYMFAATNGHEHGAKAAGVYPFDFNFVIENAPYYDTVNSTYTKYSPWTKWGDEIIEDSDDAAHIQLGSTWRLPTPEEMNNLLTNRAENSVLSIEGWGGYYNNYYGTIVTGPNKLKIFLLYTGHGEGSIVQGNRAFVWVNEVDWQATSYGACYTLGSGMSHAMRYIGGKVRPVKPIG